MMDKRYLLSLFSVFIISCSNGNDSVDNTDSQLLGTWKTESCEQINTLDSNFSNLWGTGTYQFVYNGDIKFDPEVYSDSTCTTIAFSTIGIAKVASFEDLGEETLQEGIAGNRINIIFTLPDQAISTEAFYTIINERLCFSQSYHFNATGFGISPYVIPDIDFTNCLVPNS